MSIKYFLKIIKKIIYGKVCFKILIRKVFEIWDKQKNK